jgi:alpha-ribazole phosphatase
MRLYLVRHGETDWNAARRYQGQSDIPLNRTGIQQARKLAGRLSKEKIDTIYSSDLSRARETARLIAEHHSCKIHADSRLCEVSFGTWEGQTYDEIKKSAPSALAEWEADILTTAPPNGETLEQLTARVQSILSDLCTRHADQTSLIVAHGGPLQVLLCLALDLSPSMYWQFHLSPASLSEISFFPAGAIINLLNDTCHLENIA